MSGSVVPTHHLDETVRLAAAALGRRLTEPVDLGGSQRSRVLRCRDEAGGTVVVKQFHVAGSEFLRESVGLSLLGPTPRLLAADERQRVLVMSDLGDGLPTLADLLLGADREAAWEGARSWAHDLGRAVGASHAVAQEARERIGRGTAGGPAHWDAAADLHRGLARLSSLVPAAGDGEAVVPRAVEAELSGVATLLDPRDAAVVWPTDTCPDNAVLVTDPAGGGPAWRFLDLEGTDVNHPALAAAYTLLPFATCWCVYDPPPGLTDDLLAAFTAGLAAHLPRVAGSPDWPAQVRLACAAYVVLMTGWLFDGAERARPSVGPAGRSPSYRQLVVSRWRWGAANLRADLPELARMLTAAQQWAVRAWGPDAETAGYPAFA